MKIFRAGSGELLFSWTVIERSIRAEVESGEAVYLPPPKEPTAWEPQSFELEKTTIWDFPRRGDWAVHQGDYRGNWPPQIPRNLLLRYTNPGDLIVDAFAGGGTTLIEAWLLGRRSLGIDLSHMAIQTTVSRLNGLDAAAKRDNVLLDNSARPIVVKGNALDLGKILSEASFDTKPRLICAHPPYLDSIRYSDSKDDLSASPDRSRFLAMIVSFGRQVLEVMHSEGKLAFLIGDVPKYGSVVHLGLECANVLRDLGLTLENLVVKTQHRDRSSEFYYKRESDRLLMAHEYLLIFGGR